MSEPNEHRPAEQAPILYEGYFHSKENHCKFLESRLRRTVSLPRLVISALAGNRRGSLGFGFSRSTEEGVVEDFKKGPLIIRKPLTSTQSNSRRGGFWSAPTRPL